MTTGGEDEPAVEAVGGEVGGEEGSEVKVRQIFRTGVLGEVGAELIGEEGFTGVGYGEENENREDTANAVFSELNQEGRVAAEESLLEAVFPEVGPGFADQAGVHGLVCKMESMGSIRARTAFWAWRRFSACWKMVSAWSSRISSVISFSR